MSDDIKDMGMIFGGFAVIVLAIGAAYAVSSAGDADRIKACAALCAPSKSIPEFVSGNCRCRGER